MNSAKPILYSFRRCPYAMRARMALNYCGVDYELRDILLNDKPPSMLTYSPKGTVPVLVIGNTVIDESLDIMLWALQHSDTDNWLTNAGQMTLIQTCDNKFKAQLDNYKYSDRYPLTQEDYRNHALWFIKHLNEKLLKQKFLFGEHISLADIAIFPFIRQFAFVDKPWFDKQNFMYLQNWLSSQLSSDLFKKCMKKQPVWNE